MSLLRIDMMTERALSRLGEELPPDGLARSLAVDFTDATGLEIAFALTSAAIGLEGTFRQDEDGQEQPALRAYRAAAFLSAELFAMECLGHSAPTGRALTAHWDSAEKDPGSAA